MNQLRSWSSELRKNVWVFFLSSASCILSCAAWVQAFTFNPTTSTTTLTAVNTSVAATWTGTLNGKNTGNAAAGNVSRIPIQTLLPAGAKIVAEMQSWFCLPGNTDPLCSGGHINV